MKFFLQFVLYTALAAAMLVMLMLSSFYQLMITKNKHHTQKDVRSDTVCETVIGLRDGVYHVHHSFH